MNRTKARALAREINTLFRQQNEVVLETTDIQQFLSDHEPVDSVTAMAIVREVAEANGWAAFVYDYGALVRFTQKPSTVAPGFPKQAPARA